MAEVKSFFDIANNINSSHELLPREAIEPVSNAFMLNRAMSNNYDTVFYADEANGFKFTDLYSQYLFYFYSIPKKKRYGKWEKKVDKTDHLKTVMQAYNVTEKKALEYLELLSEEQLQKLTDSISTGGRVAKGKSK